MAKNLKLSIKNTQIAEAIQLGSLKDKLAKKKEAAAQASEQSLEKSAKPKNEKTEAAESAKISKEEAPRIRARSKSAFVEPTSPHAPSIKEVVEPETPPEPSHKPETLKKKTGDERRKEIFGEEIVSPAEMPSKNILDETLESVLPPTETAATPLAVEELKSPSEPAVMPTPVEKQAESQIEQAEELNQKIEKEKLGEAKLDKVIEKEKAVEIKPERKDKPQPKAAVPAAPAVATKVERPVPPRPIPSIGLGARRPMPEHVTPPVPREKLGPTGRHVKDLFTAKPVVKEEPPVKETSEKAKVVEKPASREAPKFPEARPKAMIGGVEGEDAAKKGTKGFASKEFRDVKPARRQSTKPSTQGGEDDGEFRWRKKRQGKRIQQEDVTVRPTTLKIRVPIAIKDLASEMKLKASQLISKLFLQGLTVTLNDLIEDETTIQLLGQEFGCEITIDTSEEERIRITDKSIKEEIEATPEGELQYRPPIVAFMGHVDHGKTSLIDAIRKTNRAAGEAGAITQHIGAFRCSTSVGDIAILDTPGHEAFSAMRARGADATDIVVLVVAGDEGIRAQTLEAIKHAKAANVTIVVAINKSDKPNYNAENIYRQLADNELLPETWGGQTLTVNCSAVTGAGIKELLEMLALQAEVMELRANPHSRARGIVLESEMHKGMGSVATVLVQNGTLRIGDPVVFGQTWGRVKTMRNEFSQELQEAGPSTPVEITGLSGLPEAGDEFIVVKNEREARDIAEVRKQGVKQSIFLLKKKPSVESMMQQTEPSTKKTLNLILRADVQGSLEALRVALEKIKSTKAEINIIFAGIGEVSESDIQLAATSKAVVLGFHTQIESHAESMVKQLAVQVRLHDIIYHAIDDIKAIMVTLLDKIALETDKGKAEVKALFKSSHLGMIAGCIVSEGSIHRNHHLRIMREGKSIGKATISSLKRVKEDVREVAKGLECGIVLNKSPELAVGDVLEAFEVSYITQEL